jgi:hypothetical protein
LFNRDFGLRRCACVPPKSKFDAAFQPLVRSVAALFRDDPPLWTALQEHLQPYPEGASPEWILIGPLGDRFPAVGRLGQVCVASVIDAHGRRVILLDPWHNETRVTRESMYVMLFDAAESIRLCRRDSRAIQRAPGPTGHWPRSKSH